MAATSAPRKSVAHTATKSGVGDSEDMFEYTLNDGTRLSIPRFDSVKPGLIRKIRKLDQTDQFFTVMETLVDADTLAIIDELDSAEFVEFQRAWATHSGADLGES